MPRSKFSQFLQSVVPVGAFVLCAGLFPLPALAQPPANNPNEMCGDGTTFTVSLPGRAGSLPLGIAAPNDSVTLPRGCRIYALLVSGYSRNNKMDEFTFYKVAKFVAENNGYAHYAWWNNLMGEYLSHPLHNFPPQTAILNGQSVVIQPSPGNLQDTHLLGFIPKNFADVTTFLPKAVPEEDFQFQDDARAFLQAIRANNPNAIIIVAGHSMGGNAVARLGATTSNVVDVLAPIDPVGNRSTPVGQLFRETFNWNRWRVANNLRGYRQRDCVRNALNLCQDFDPNPFRLSFQCTVGPLLSSPPLVGSRAPLLCPQLNPIVVTGTRPTIGSNVRYLYHRWQKEFTFPFDFDEDEPLSRPGSFAAGILGGNYQQPFARNALGESNPNKSCGLFGNVNVGTLVIQVLGLSFTLPDPGVQPGDPRDPNLSCSPFDGHGEIVGIRTTALKPYGTEMRDAWPCYPALTTPTPNCGPDDPALRRQLIIEMATAPSPDPNKTILGPHNWLHEPENPNLDAVADDIIAIVQHLLSQQQPPSMDSVAPVTVATTNPTANGAGWHMEDVTVDLTASDGGGSGVQEIEHSLLGAQMSSAAVTAGGAAQEVITAEGITTVNFFARDNAGNVEATQSSVVKLDKTSPQITAVTDVPPNANGWNNTDVTVMFPAFDALSGLAFSSPDMTVSPEGSAQEIIGSAEDDAGNQGAASVILNIDKTAPDIALASRTPASNAAGWNRTDVSFTWNCTDGLSSAVSPQVTQTVTTEGAAQMVIGTCADRADNAASDTQVGINIDKHDPIVSITTPPDGAVYLLNAAVNADYACMDSLSGVRSCSGPVANGAAVNTSSAGGHPFTVNSKDAADNTASSTHNYAVHYAFSGFGNPVAPMPMVNVAKAGQTVPIKYYLRDAGGAFLSDPASFVSITSAPVSCNNGAPTGPTESAGTAGNTSLHYDATAGQFIYNWKTERVWSGLCRRLHLTLNDGTQHSALFQFK